MQPTSTLDPMPEPSPTEATTEPFPLSTPARALLAVLSIGVATIHLVMVPSHAGEWLVEGLAFALAGWFSLAWAVGVAARPSKRLLLLGIVANLVFIAVWALTRTAGLPVGPHAGHAEVASFVDLTCVGLEAAIVLACVVLMRSPRLGEDLDTSALVAVSIVPVAVIALTTAVLASPAARTHSHDSHADGADVAAGDGHVHDGSGDSAAGHSHAATPAVPASARCDWDFNTVAFWNQNPPDHDDGTHAHSHGSAAESADPAAAGATVGNKAGLQVWAPMTDATACSTMKADLATMASFAQTYPTAQDALDAGCIRVTTYVPGIAAHYACFKNWDGTLDVNNPEMLLYGGSQPWAPMVGLSYYTLGSSPATDWQGGKMPFHVHEGLCVKGALVIGGDGSDKASCEARGGRVMGKTGFMGHYWLPSCSSPDGVFSADNPRLDLGVAKFNDDPANDPAKGGDPTKLQANPCQGAANQSQDRFGAPDGASNETAAGAPAGS